MPHSEELKLKYLLHKKPDLKSNVHIAKKQVVHVLCIVGISIIANHVNHAIIESEILKIWFRIFRTTAH
jgi:hypothetical protein